MVVCKAKKICFKCGGLYHQNWEEISWSLKVGISVGELTETELMKSGAGCFGTEDE